MEANMKKHYYIITGICLLVIACLAVYCLRKRLACQEDNAEKGIIHTPMEYGVRQDNITQLKQGVRAIGENAEAETAKEPDVSEQWLTPFEMDEGKESLEDKFHLLGNALDAEYELHILNKYDGWTEEQLDQRLRELAQSKEPSRLAEQDEIEHLGVAQGRAAIRAIPLAERERYYDIPRVSSDTEEARKFRKIRRQPQMTDEDREFLNNVVNRLNQVAQTNDLLRNYWSLTYSTDDADYLGGNVEENK